MLEQVVGGQKHNRFHLPQVSKVATMHLTPPHSKTDDPKGTQMDSDMLCN